MKINSIDSYKNITYQKPVMQKQVSCSDVSKLGQKQLSEQKFFYSPFTTLKSNISFQRNISKEENIFCHKAIHSASAACGTISALMGEGAAVALDTPLLWITQYAMFRSLQKKFSINFEDHMLYIARQFMMGQALGVGGARILISWAGIGGHAASGGTASVPITGAVRAVNSALSTGITEKMGWGYVSSVEKNTMTLKNQAINTAIYLVGAEIFGDSSDALGTNDSANIEAALENVPKKDLATLGSTLKNLFEETLHIDRFAFMFMAPLAQKIILSKDKLTKDDLKQAVGMALLNTTIYDLLDYKYEQTITEDATETIRKMGDELKNNPSVWNKFEEYRNEILNGMGSEKAGTQEFIDQFKNKKFVFNLAMLSSELSKDLADKYRKRNWGDYKAKHDSLNKGLEENKETSRGLDVKLTQEQQKILQEELDNLEIKMKEISKNKSIGANTGFSQMAGYFELKQKLKDEIVLPIELEKSGFSAIVPGAVLFYGPSGTGKTTMCDSLAQEAGTRFDARIKCDRKPDIFIEKLKNALKLAEENFKKDKRRTIISLDEFCALDTSNEELRQNLIDIFKHCSQNNHTTLLLTTNSPQNIDKRLLDNINLKVPIASANEKDLSSLLKYYYKGEDVENINFESISKEVMLSAEPNAYSNTQIKSILNTSFNYTQEDILQKFTEKPPMIKESAIIEFNKTKENFEKEIV